MHHVTLKTAHTQAYSPDPCCNLEEAQQQHALGGKPDTNGHSVGSIDTKHPEQASPQTEWGLVQNRPIHRQNGGSWGPGARERDSGRVTANRDRASFGDDRMF